MKRHIYSDHVFNDAGKAVELTTFAEYGKRKIVSGKTGKHTEVKIDETMKPQTVSPIVSGFVSIDRSAIERSFRRHNRKLAKRRTAAERIAIAKQWEKRDTVSDGIHKGLTFAPISADSRMSDVLTYETVRRRFLELLNTPKPKPYRAKRGEAPVIHRREVGKEGTQETRKPKRKPVVNHSIGKNANLIAKGYEDAKQNAIVWLLENGFPVSIIDDETHDKHKLAWRVGWRRHVRSVQFTQAKEKTFATDIDTLERITARKPSHLSHDKIRQVCKLTSKDKQTRLVAYMHLVEFTQREIAERIGVSLSTVEKCLRSIRLAWRRTNEGKIEDIFSLT